MRIHTRAFLMLFLALRLTSAGAAQAQATPAPLTAAQRQAYIGFYELTLPGPQARKVVLRVYELPDALMGRLGEDAPQALIYQGNDSFRPQGTSGYLLAFTLSAGHATGVRIASPLGPITGVRVQPTDTGWLPSSPDALEAELARMDSLLFDAAYVSCDMARVEALFTPDAEFYHDRNGFQGHDALMNAFRALTAACPARRGIRRVLVPGSLHAYPIKDYGAVQVGLHRFVQQGATGSTIAQFVTLWRLEGTEWRASRVLSFDHRDVPDQ